MLRFMSIQQAPTKKPTLCATTVLSSRKANIVRNRVGLREKKFAKNWINKEKPG